MLGGFEANNLQARKEGEAEEAATTNGAPTNVPGQTTGLTETTNEALTAAPGEEGSITVDTQKTGKSAALRPRKQLSLIHI